jgi:lysophospholipid acyltransferase (LPLAT)-like uncharacterized protein
VSVPGRVLRLLFRSWRIDARLPDGSEMPAREYPFAGKLFALPEGDAIALAGIIVDRGFTALAAPGRDGDRAAAALRAIGCRVVRGATRRGGAPALRRLAAIFRESDSPGGIVVDGPLGPAGEPKPGIVWLARETGRGIVPLGTAARPTVVFRRTWSRLHVPLPAARIAVVCGETLFVPRETGDAGITELTEELGRRLSAAARDAAAFLSSRRRERAAPPAVEERA